MTQNHLQFILIDTIFKVHQHLHTSIQQIISKINLTKNHDFHLDNYWSFSFQNVEGYFGNSILPICTIV